MDTKDTTVLNRRAVDVAIGLMLGVALGGPVRAQAVSMPPSPEIGSTLTAETLANLPLADNQYSVLETMQPEAIADRFNNAGLNVGENARVGGFLGSWS